MNETIYLRISRRKVEAMTKSLPWLNRGEIPVRLNLEIKDEAFREPVIVKDVVINDWREGIDMADVDFKGTMITEEEAEVIRQRRLEKMQQILEEQGYEVTKPASEEE